MSKTPRERVLEALSGRAQDDAPVAIFSQSATVGMMDATGVGWPEAHSDPEKMAILGAAQADLFGFESVRAPFCMTAEAERLGCRVTLGGRTSSPMVVGHAFEFDPFDGSFSDLPDAGTGDYVSGRMSTIVEAIGFLRKGWGDRYPVVCGALAPLTLMGQVVGAEGLILGTILCPDRVREWSSALGRLQAEYIGELSDAGADILFLIDGDASPSMMDPAAYWDLAGSRCAPLMRGSLKTILHICGDALPIAKDMARTGADALSLESTVDPYDLKKAVRGVPVVGSVGPVFPLLTGSPGDIAEEARNCEDAGFEVISPGCGLSVLTPDGNLRALRNYRSFLSE